MDALEESSEERIRESMADVAAGRMVSGTARDLMTELLEEVTTPNAELEP